MKTRRRLRAAVGFCVATMFVGAPSTPGQTPSKPAVVDAIGGKRALEEGRALLQAERLEDALAAFRRARAADPKLLDARVFEAETLYLLERHDEAVRVYEAVVAADPALAAHLYNFGAALLALGRPADAKARFAVMAEKAPKAEARARATFGVGAALSDLGDEPAARAAWEAALKLDPSLLRAKYRLGVSRIREGVPKAAIPLLLAVVAADPFYDGAAYNLALAYAANGDAAEAAAWRKRFVELKAIKNRIDGAKLRLKVAPDDLASLLVVARGYAEAGMTEIASKRYASLARRSDVPREALTEWLAILEKLGAVHDAEKLRARIRHIDR